MTQHSRRKHHYLRTMSIFLIVAVLVTGILGCGPNEGPTQPIPDPGPSVDLEIRTWHDLDAIRDDLCGHYVLIADLHANTAGYDELVGNTADGKGWEPIGEWGNPFIGTFDGNGYEIRGLLVNRPDESQVGLFGSVGVGGVVKNVGLVDVDVTGDHGAGALAGNSFRVTVSNSYSSGSVTGRDSVGGLVGWNGDGTLSNSHSACRVTGKWSVGGLVGATQDGTISDSYATGSVTGEYRVGGLVGTSSGGTITTITGSHATGTVTGVELAGGLVGESWGSTIIDSYATGSVTGERGVGGLVAEAGYSSIVNCYSTGRVTGQFAVGGLVARIQWGSPIMNSYYSYDEVLINGDNVITVGALFGEDFDKWMANNKSLDIDDRLTQQDGYYLIGDVADFKQLLAFGYDASLRFRLTDDLDLAGQPDFFVPYMAGDFDGNGHRISNVSFTFDSVCHVGLFGYLAPGAEVSDLVAENVNMSGSWRVGGLVGFSDNGSISGSFSTGTVTGADSVGGLVGGQHYGSVSHSHATCTVSGEWSVGGLVGYMCSRSTIIWSHATGSVTGGDNVGGLVGKSDWRCATIWSYATGTVSGEWRVGGLVGRQLEGDVSYSHATGSVSGKGRVGGLIGENWSAGTVTDSYATGTVTRTSGADTDFGGFVGYSSGGITNCYSTGSVHYEGEEDPTDKGFAGNVDTGRNYAMTGSFWDTETSGQISTAGDATGKSTTEMQSLATFQGNGWVIVAVGPGETDDGYTWNIVEELTYPFLSWQSVP